MNNGSYTNATTAVAGGTQSVAVRVTTSATAGATVKAILSVDTQTVECAATTKPDITPPTGTITFPPAVSLTEGATVIMRGTVKDDASAIKSVTINGAPATVDAAKGTWELKTAALVDGANNLKLEVIDAENNVNSDAAQVVVTKGDITKAFPENGGVDFVGPQTVAWDNLDGRNRALVMDVDAKALVAVDLNTGVRTTLSTGFVFNGKDAQGGNNYVGAPVVLDRKGKILYTCQTDVMFPVIFSEVVSINLLNGVKTNITDGATGACSGLVLHHLNSGSRIYVGSAWAGTITAWDMEEGTNLIVNLFSYSDAAYPFVPNDKNLFSNAGGMALDKKRNRILMASLSGDQFVLSVDVSKSSADPLRGERKMFSGAAVPNDSVPFSTAGNNVLTSVGVDEDGSRALLIDRLKTTIFSLVLSDDSTDGARSVFSSNDKSPINKMVDPYGLHVEAGSPYVLIADKGRKGLMAIDLETGERVIVSKTAN